jgi:serine/threonine protein kinase
VLLKSVAHSLKILHDLHIVHGDLKPDNVLVKRTELGYTSKLIDFDSSYLAGRPPAATEIVGTINYYSPELLGYIQEDGVEPSELGTASDVFALGLIYSEFLTGKVPAFDPAYGEPSVAARSGVVLRVDRTGLDPALADLVDRMMLAAPAARPTIAEVHAALMALRGTGDAPAPAAAPPTAPPAASSGLRGKLVGRVPATPPAAPARPPAAAPASGLKGKLIGRAPREDGPGRAR